MLNVGDREELDLTRRHRARCGGNVIIVIICGYNDGIRVIGDRCVVLVSVAWLIQFGSFNVLIISGNGSRRRRLYSCARCKSRRRSLYSCAR